MSLEGKNIGILLTSSFYNYQKLIKELKKLKKQHVNLIFFIEDSFYNMVKEEEFIKEIQYIAENTIMFSLQEWEDSELKDKLDILIILPCMSHLIAKLANKIADNFETKLIHHSIQLKNPIILAISCEDGLSTSAENLGKLFNIRNYYFVPFKQTNPITRPRAITFDSSYLYKTIICALNKEQIQPILLSI